MVATDGGRVCRPLIIVDKKSGKSGIDDDVIDDLKAEKIPFSSLIRKGLLEYIDVNESNNTLVALNERYIEKGHTTHLEIDPLTILGVVSGLIPYPHHNQSPRNTYQCAMGKQSIGTIAMNQLNRLDGLLYLMVYPQKPMVRSLLPPPPSHTHTLPPPPSGAHPHPGPHPPHTHPHSPQVRTRTLDLVNFDEVPAGQQATLAVMSYSGYAPLIQPSFNPHSTLIQPSFNPCPTVGTPPVSP